MHQFDAEAGTAPFLKKKIVHLEVHTGKENTS